MSALDLHSTERKARTAHERELATQLRRLRHCGPNGQLTFNDVRCEPGVLLRTEIRLQALRLLAVVETRTEGDGFVTETRAVPRSVKRSALRSYLDVLSPRYETVIG